MWKWVLKTLYRYHQLIHREKFVQDWVFARAHLLGRPEEAHLPFMQKHQSIRQFFGKTHVVRDNNARKMHLHFQTLDEVPK